MTVDIGRTLGVEEEYALVGPDGALADAPEVAATAHRLIGDSATPEISTSQLEVVTLICDSLSMVRSQIELLRRTAVQAAAEHDCRVLASGTHPFSSWRDQRMSKGDVYKRLVERWGLLARQQLITAQHVHVGVPADLCVPVLDRIGPDLPLLLAMSASSPYWEGEDTGYASYRSMWFSRWPVVGTLPVLGTRAAYDALVASLIATGVAESPSRLYWDARPSERFPTVEVRVADTMPLLDDAVLHAALVRSLVRVAAREDDFLPVPPDLVRAARWRAARFGLEGSLLDPATGALVPAAELVRDLLRRVREDLEELGDWDEVSTLAEELLARGTSSTRQRRVFAQEGSLEAVVSSVVAEFDPEGPGSAD
ncbi:MAG: putative Carboxylate-amine ligase [Frankiales bacterium]|nr:putative Carboxylate-amine ligase [Frankiales bacterium]